MNDIDLAVTLMDGPSYDRACSLVPSEYVEAWEWFLSEEQRGGVWTSLPHHTKEESPQYQYRLRIGSDLFPVTRDSGIFWPGQDRVKQDPNKTFALSVHNSSSASSSLSPMTAVARCRTAASAKHWRLHISRITRALNRKLSAMAFCFGATYMLYSMLI